MADVDILLATYNGSRYIEQQIQSIQDQTYKNWRLIVHDDGSTDHTVDIVRQWLIKDSRIVLLEDMKKSLGAANNFLHLLGYSRAPYIMFCDQDDVWLPSKIELMLMEIKVVGGPALVYCNAHLLNADNILRENVVLYRRTNLRDTLFLNGGVHGCLTLFNRELLERLLHHRGYVCMHDFLLTIAAVTFGEIKYIDRVLVHYRQHDTNVTGSYETNFLRRVKRFIFSEESVVDKRHFETVLAFYRSFENLLCKSSREVFLGYFEFVESRSLFRRVYIVLKNGFNIGGSVNVLILKTLLRKNINAHR